MNERIKKNFTQVNENQAVTTTRERETCFAVTTRFRSRPLYRKQDNYILEKINETHEGEQNMTDENKQMIRLKTNTLKGYDEVTAGDGVRLAHPTSTKARGRTQRNQTGTLSACNSCDWGAVDKDYRIRRLTPVECERLQAFPDNWTKYGKDGELISDTQRYKCIGNAVTTTVITAIVDEMFDEK